MSGAVPDGTTMWRMGLLGEGRRPFKAEKRVRNPHALPLTPFGFPARLVFRRG